MSIKTKTYYEPIGFGASFEQIPMGSIFFILYTLTDPSGSETRNLLGVARRTDTEGITTLFPQNDIREHSDCKIIITHWLKKVEIISIDFYCAKDEDEMEKQGYMPMPPAHKPRDLKCVPYQRCPVCNGTGMIQNTNNLGTFSITNTTCDICNGRKIIPQAVVAADVNS